MCLLCSTAAVAPAVFCSVHIKEWKDSSEFRRVDCFQKAKDARLPALHRAALADFVDRTLKERANGTPEAS